MPNSTLTTILKRLRTAGHVALALAPGPIKLPIYRRVFGFRIAKGARIGVSVLDVPALELGAGARIGHDNVLTGCEKVSLGVGARIDHFNILRGGKEIALEDRARVMRFNVLNSIPDNDAETPVDPRLRIGEGSTVVAGHRLDFTDRIDLGRHVIVAGRNSSLWTHNRQQTQPIVIGDFCYLGSEVRLAPGAGLARESVLGLGAVLTKPVADEGVMVAGVPGKIVRPLTEAERGRLHKNEGKNEG